MNEYVPETLLRILQSPLCKVCLKLRKCLQSILDLKYNYYNNINRENPKDKRYICKRAENKKSKCKKGKGLFKWE